MIGHREISCTRGFVILVDAQDYERLSGHRWHAAHINGSYFKPRRTDRSDGGKRDFYLVKEVAGSAPKGQVIDHINGNPFDNRRANLRFCSQSDNVCNKSASRHKRNGLPLGVYQDRPNSRFRAIINKHGVRHRLGSFDTVQEASAAYATAARQLHGDYTRAGR